MTKTKLETFIRKYYLGGRIDRARWKSANGVLSTKEISPDRKFLIEVKMDNFTEFDNAVVTVTDTKRAEGFLKILNDDVTIELGKDAEDGNRVLWMMITDGHQHQYIASGDPDVLLNVPKNVTVSGFDVEIKLTEDLIRRFLGAKSALPQAELFTLITNHKKNELQLILGYSSNNNTDRSVIPLETTPNKHILKRPVSFSSDHFKEILTANPDAKDTFLNVAGSGLATVKISNDGISAEYHMIEFEVED